MSECDDFFSGYYDELEIIAGDYLEIKKLNQWIKDKRKIIITINFSTKEDTNTYKEELELIKFISFVLYRLIKKGYSINETNQYTTTDGNEYFTAINTSIPLNEKRSDSEEEDLAWYA